jgi:hypothetical protein
MSVLRPRNRLVNFRLSEDEFERLKSSCDVFGARSVSDFARSSVLSRLAEIPSSNESSGRITDLDGKVATLEARVGQLIRLLDAVQGQEGRPALTAGESFGQAASGA